MNLRVAHTAWMREYHAKADSILVDQKFYKLLDKDPTSSTERKMNATLLMGGTKLIAIITVGK